MSKPRSSFLKKRALDEHAIEIRRLGKRVIADAIEIGKRLTECREIVGHGKWLSWLEREFDGWSRQTADNFMNVFEVFGTGKVPNFGTLTLSSIYLLAAPSTPKEVRDSIVERASKGEKIKGTDVKADVKAAIGSKRELPTARPAESGGSYTVNVPTTTTTKRIETIAYQREEPDIAPPSKPLTGADLIASLPASEPRKMMTGADLLTAEARRFVREFVALHVRGRDLSEFTAAIAEMTDDERRGLSEALHIARDLIAQLEQGLNADAAERRGRLKLVTNKET